MEIDFLKVAQQMEKAGVKGRILPLVRRSIKNMAAGEPYRLINKPGDVVEIDGVKSLVTNQGKLCRI